MDFARIQKVIAIDHLANQTVTIVGTGGGANLCRNLVRCGVRRLKLVDLDTVEAVNICRQEHMTDQIGMTKVEAVAAELTRINPKVSVETFTRDFTGFTEAEMDHHFGDTDVFVFATDSFHAQARGNEVALRLRKKAVWIGVYAGGCAGEIVFWHPSLASCYRCLCEARYAAFANGFQNPSSDSATILDVQFIDSLAAMLVIGLLTVGADNRFGKLIAQLGERNFLQVKIDPAWNFAGRDVVQEELRIPEGTNAYFSFCTIARRDPEPGGYCPDCQEYRRPAAQFVLDGHRGEDRNSQLKETTKDETHFAPDTVVTIQQTVGQGVVTKGTSSTYPERSSTSSSSDKMSD